MKRLAFLLFALLPSSVFGWGEDGHRIVCQIAFDELTPSARIEVRRLLALDPDFESFADSCLFADSPERIRFLDHFMNLPRSTRAITSAECPLAESCVISAIQNDFLVLQNAEASDAEKLLALKLLGHWVGDVHQPLHVSFQDDRGGNSNNVNVDDSRVNLHGVWDYQIIARNLGDDFLRIAENLHDSITEKQRIEWQHDSPIEWVDESYQITISPSVNYCVQKQGACWYTNDNMMLDKGEPWRDIEITDDYLKMHSATVSLRLQQAAIRLAELLNQAFQ
jgi:hypothetical protein